MSQRKTDRSKLPFPEQGFVVTFLLTVTDKQRSTKFYTDILGGELVIDRGENEISIIQLANSWLILHTSAEVGEDLPGFRIEPPTETGRLSCYLELRVADIWQTYREWSAKEAQFVTEPKDRGAEIRCYLRDPDGYYIELGQEVAAALVD
jgi:catechol 2,3-dioxygenase-like lactoylglutathione lyase family enzyme